MKSRQENTHPTHPVRNFFYTLWSLLNLIAFLALFYALSMADSSLRLPLLVGAGAVLLVALIFGFFRPLLKKGGKSARIKESK